MPKPDAVPGAQHTPTHTAVHEDGASRGGLGVGGVSGWDGQQHEQRLLQQRQQLLEVQQQQAREQAQQQQQQEEQRQGDLDWGALGEGTAALSYELQKQSEAGGAEPEALPSELHSEVGGAEPVAMGHNGLHSTVGGAEPVNTRSAAAAVPHAAGVGGGQAQEGAEVGSPGVPSFREFDWDVIDGEASAGLSKSRAADNGYQQQQVPEPQRVVLPEPIPMLSLPECWKNQQEQQQLQQVQQAGWVGGEAVGGGGSWTGAGGAGEGEDEDLLSLLINEDE